MIDYLKVFLVGGVICLIAQIMMDYFKLQTPYIMVTYVTGGVLLSFIGIYDKIVDFGGAGATVPIIGFGYSLYNGVVKAVEQDGFIGIFTGGITATAGGIAAAIFFGYIMAVVFTPKAKP
ncbi:stage V sporulation protein AE [[Clostridium] sordellii]|uniref:Stage V sporulation protein AE n=1 Tax=Paraclostridium sordellii TaxID=1505 RepID=A0A0A8WFT9_PARSO|nr:stage V sporulation protein AE [Paeniclostridium sordellii]EPZ60731.1 stage V sporulation protein AE [[Clostridium] sordellii VPI 9048] [Paeniclostridium sordellii VPI 9048]MDU1455282.1 stage V sporulation protein AE [Paeniclostridium sordellii]QYE97674.1 stage V sporulation protein AE [Paeniclostridium sordellii]CEK39428.1 Stage V sporulation protein AE [[Clostridium] sordellii] [Paeniclostridium sordellii]CEN80322.1 stage V sporulation protein AE [[Clostridium] sordellii] [Paeniclostridiu